MGHPKLATDARHNPDPSAEFACTQAPIESCPRTAIHPLLLRTCGAINAVSRLHDQAQNAPNTDGPLAPGRFT